MSYQQALNGLYSDLVFTFKSAHGTPERHQLVQKALSTFAHSMNVEIATEANQQGLVWRTAAGGPGSIGPAPKPQAVTPGDLDGAFQNFRALVEWSMCDPSQDARQKDSTCQAALNQLAANLRPMLGGTIRQVVQNDETADFAGALTQMAAHKPEGQKRRSDWYTGAGGF